MFKPRRDVFTLALLMVLPLIGLSQRTGSGGQRGGSKSTAAVPTISSYSPTSVTAGAATFTLTVNGTNYVAGSTTVVWSGPASGNIAATVNSTGTSLTAPIPASLVATAGSASFNVSVSGRNGGNSNVAGFTISPSTATTTTSTTTTTTPLSITTTSLPAGTAGTAYSCTLAASGGTSPYAWTASTALPAGLTLASAGGISGTPTTQGTYSFSAQVKDATNATASYTYSLLVGAPLTAPLSITTTSVPNGTTGTAYSATVSASGGTSPYSWTTAGGTLPPGISLASSGALSGNPTSAGTYSFSASVSDSSANTATKSYSITIGTTSSVGVVFQTGFESGSFADWTQAGYQYAPPLFSIQSAASGPGLVRSGNYSGHIHYLLCGAQTPSPLSLGSVAGGSLPARTYYVKYTYVSASNNTNPNKESLPSAEQSINLNQGELLSIASPSAQPGVANGHSGYVIYISAAPGLETNQSGSSAIALGTNWTEPSTGLITGTSAPPTTNAACGATHSTAGYMGYGGYWMQNFAYSQTGTLATYGLDHVFVRGYVKFHINPGGALSPQRKLFYLHGPNNSLWFIFNSPSSSTAFMFDTQAVQTGAPETFSASSQNQTNYNYCTNPQSSITTCSRLLYTWVPDEWYYLEVEIKLNSINPATSTSAATPNYDGIVRVWVQQVTSNTRPANAAPLKILETTNANLRNTVNVGYTEYAFGDQADRGSGEIIDEERYWDDIVISGTGPIGP